MRPAYLCFNDWAGTREHPVVIVGQTRERYRIRLPDGATEPMKLAGRCRWLRTGETALVPKSAVRVMEKPGP